MAYKCLLDYAAFSMLYGDCIEQEGICLRPFETIRVSFSKSSLLIVTLLVLKMVYIAA